MAEVTQPGSPTPQAAPAAPAPAEPQGLEKVYQDFGIEDTASQFQPQSPQPAAQPQAPAPVAPKFDPFDPNFSSHMERVAKAAAEAHSTLQATQGKLTALERQLHQKAVEADIKQAVGLITEKAGIDPEIAEVALEAKARQDPKFLQIWNNRQKNPKAYNAALQAVASEFQQKYTVRQDPQLAENQRAVKASQQQMATTHKPSQQDEWSSMTPSERQAKIRLMISRG
jgi:hypothetical protein